ncbi:MAG: SH3 domain-containing protein [Acidobacteriota bacterium]|nr:SH3 domain-containing protein [Acidobacteriota bacterium]
MTAATMPKMQTTKLFITTAFDVNLREKPSAGAREVGELSVGTRVRSLERSAEKQTIAGKTDYWHRIETVGAENKKTGWVFGGFLLQFDPAKRETIYSVIAAERSKAAGEKFAENAELVDFLTASLPEVKTPANAAELNFVRLIALKNALAAIPIEKQSDEPYKTFIEKQKANIVYSEPSAQWYVRSDLFWDLARKYKNLPAGEKIAWAGANNQLPGECEGYLNCHLYSLKATHGAYLEHFPRGAHAPESLKTIREWLEPVAADAAKKEVYTAPTEVSEKAEFYQTLKDLRVRISKTGLFEKDAVLRQLDKIAEGYK